MAVNKLSPRAAVILLTKASRGQRRSPHRQQGARPKSEYNDLAGLSILQSEKRAARMGRNLATGEAIKIKASKKVAFRAAKNLKMAV